MSSLYFLEKMLRTIQKRREQLVETITGGSVPDFVAYKSLRARLEELDTLAQELRDLHNKEMTSDE